MRSYASLLILENIFEDIPTLDQNINNLVSTIFTPSLPVVEHDCGTTLGKLEALNFESQGLIELATGVPLNKSRVTDILTLGVYNIRLRHLSTCISKNGICQQCYSSTYPGLVVPEILKVVNIIPEYLVNAEVLEGVATQQAYTSIMDPLLYNKCYVFLDGMFLELGVDYTFNNGILQLTSSMQTSKDIIVRYMSTTRSPFLVWLAETYSGSILGMKPISTNVLPIRSLLLTSVIEESMLQIIEENIKANIDIPNFYSEYSSSIRDPLEKALFMITLYSIYVNP